LIKKIGKYQNIKKIVILNLSKHKKFTNKN